MLKGEPKRKTAMDLVKISGKMLLRVSCPTSRKKRRDAFHAGKSIRTPAWTSGKQTA